MADSLVDLQSQMSSTDDAPATPQETANVQGALNASEDSSAASDGNVFHSTPNATGSFFYPKEAAPVLAGVGLPNSTPAPPARGDDLMDHAEKLADFTDDDKAKAQLIRGSLDLLIQKGKEDPNFGAQLAKSLSGVQGEAYAQKAVDEADKIKTDYLKKTDPDHFNSDSAAVTSFLNSATFGQLSRIYGAVGSTVMGQPYEDVVKQQAEKARLMAKEFPKANIAGTLASYLIPGSPVKALFESAASVAAKGAGSVIARVVANPSLMTKALGMSAAAGAAGAGSVGAVQGFAGQDTQAPFNLDRGLQQGATDAVVGGVMGAMLPPAGALISKGVTAAAPFIKAGAQGFSRNVGKVVQELSGTSPNALRMFNKNPSVLRHAANTEGDIGQQLVDFLMDQRKSKLPELAHADQLLDQLPNVPARRVISYLRGFKPGTNPQLDSQVGLLHQWADRMEKSIPAGSKDGKIPARLMRQFVDDLQDASKDQFGKDSNMYVTALKTASRRARMEIVDAAKNGGGQVGATYVKLMDKAAEKVNILKYVSRQLGRDPQTMAARSQQFIDKVFGKNKEFLRARMADLDTKFGTNFLEKARVAQMAQDVGEGGVPSYFPNSQTGRSSLGSNIAGAAGGAVGLVTHGVGGGAGGYLAGKAVGAAVSSPRLAAHLIGASDAMTGVAKRMVANPEAIARLAGIRMAKVPQGIGEGLFRPANPANAAFDVANRGLTALRVPVEIQRLAQEIRKTLIKDGPKSAMSTIRVIADTPYFMGLVHYFDLAQRKQDAEKTGKAISYMKK